MFTTAPAVPVYFFMMSHPFSLDYEGDDFADYLEKREWYAQRALDEDDARSEESRGDAMYERQIAEGREEYLEQNAHLFGYNRTGKASSFKKKGLSSNPRPTSISIPKPRPPDQKNNKLFGLRYDRNFKKVSVTIISDPRLNRRLETRTGPGAPVSVYLGVHHSKDYLFDIRHPNSINSTLQSRKYEYCPSSSVFVRVDCSPEPFVFLPVRKLVKSEQTGQMVHGKTKEKNSNHHQVKSALNGNNGSATNTDDHDSRHSLALMELDDECPVCWNTHPLVRLHDACNHLFCVECCWALFDQCCPLCRAHPAPVDTPSVGIELLNYRDNWYLEDYFRMYTLNRLFWIHHFGRSDVDQLHILRHAVSMSELLVCVYRRYRWYRHCDRWLAVPPPDLLLAGMEQHIVVSPQLNGNNGEWTNGDDMAQQAAEHLPRRNNLGVNGRHAPPEGGFQPLLPGARNRRNAEARVNHRVIAPAPVNQRVDPPPWRQRYHIQDLGERGFVYENAYSPVPFPDGEGQFLVRRPGSYPNVLRSGPGWMECGNGGKNEYVSSAWADYTIGAYSTFYVQEPEFRIRTLRVLVDRTARLVKPSCIGQQTLNAVRSTTSQVYTGLPSDLLDELWLYLTKLARWNGQVSERASKGIGNYASANPFAVLAIDEYSNDAIDSIDFGRPMRIPAIDCDVFFPYAADPDIRVEGDVVMVPDGMEPAGERPELIPTPGGDRWYRTMMCSFEGPDRKFVEYELNDLNANKALKRLVAKNDNHDERNSWQAYTARRVYDTFTHDQFGVRHAQRVAEAASIPLWEPDREGMAAEAIDFAAVQRASDLMCRYHLERFNRSYIDYLVHVIPEMSEWVYYRMYLGYMEHVEPLWSRWANANIPHVKKKLRQGYVMQKGEEGTQDIMVTRLEAKVKRELAKPGKAPRLYVGYDAGCMYANELPEFVKVAMQTSFDVQRNGHFFTVFAFSKPRTKEIDEVFHRIAVGLELNTHILCVYSDDSVWAGNVNGELYAYNCDIASCDASVKSMGFFLSGMAMANFDVERAIGLIEQCKIPITLATSVAGRNAPRRKIRIHREVDGVTVPIEGSGTVLTTMNNFMVMLMTVFVYIERGVYGDPDGIRRAGILCGLNLEVSDNFSQRPEKLQFLKFSPILCSDNRYHMVRNLGPMLRSFGKVEGDLSPKQLGMTPLQFNETNWADRMDLFLSGVVKGYVHDPQHFIVDALRERFTTPTINLVESGMQMETAPCDYTVIAESLASRYDLTSSDLMDLATNIRQVRLGQVVVSNSLASIYFTDYSL